MLRVASALLLTTVIALWGYSRLWTSGIVYVTHNGQLNAMAAERHGFLFLFSGVSCGKESALTVQPASVPDGEFQAQVHSWLFDATRDKFHVVGFHLASGTIDSAGIRAAYTAVILPYWFAACVLGVLPARMVSALYLVRRRKRSGQCLNCGYDLRHAPQRCPECGTIRGRKAELPVTSPRTRSIRLLAGATILILIVGAGVSIRAMIKRGRGLEVNASERSAAACGLDRSIAEFVIPMGADAREIVELLRRETGTPINVDWPALDAQGAGRAFISRFHHPVEQRFRDVTLATMVEVFLNGDAVPDDGYVFVSTPQRLPKFVRAYDLTDVLTQIDRRTQADQALYGTAPLTDSQKLDLIAKTMVDFIFREQWRVNGGQIGSEWVIGHWLVVEHNQVGHREVARFLATLREPPYDWRRGIDPRPAVCEGANLERRIAELRLNTVTGMQAIAMIARQSASNIVLHWSWQSAGDNMLFGRVWMRLFGVSVRQALNSLLIEEGLAYIDSGFVARNNVIEVYCDDLPLVSELRAYDVHDLIDEAIAYRKQRVSPRPLAPPGRAFMYGRPVDIPNPEEVVDAIRLFLEDTVSSESWRDYGGAIGGVSNIGGTLLIQQTVENHRRIAAALRALRSGGSMDGTEVGVN